MYYTEDHDDNNRMKRINLYCRVVCITRSCPLSCYSVQAYGFRGFFKGMFQVEITLFIWKCFILSDELSNVFQVSEILKLPYSNNVVRVTKVTITI